MAEVLLMPRLSDTMTEGVIASWQKKVGDTVKKGDVLAEIETDKATMELESYHDGVLLYIGVEQGGKLAVNDLMAIIGKAGEDISALVKQNSGGGSAPAAEPAKAEATPAPTPTQAAPAAKSTAIDISKMDEVVLMPRLSDTMTEGVIADWQKNVGDKVKKGEILADIETDKATMELESYKDGILLYQGAKAGEKIAVNDLLAIIGAEGTDVDAIVAAAKGGGTAPASSPATETASQPSEATPAVAETPVATSSNEGGRIFASPLAKKIAADKGIDLAQVQGSGDNGRIVRADVENFTPQQKSAPATTSTSSAPTFVPAVGQESYEDVPVSQMRKVIAKRLAESKFTSPHFYVTMAIDMDAAVAARPKLNSKDGKIKISFNDLVVKAVAIALRQHPDVNSSWLGDTIRINHHVNVGVAVAVPDGLVVPVLKFADNMSLTQISAAVKTFATKAKDKKLTPAEMEGSTFTISNLGMYGVDQFTGIINPPNACILAVGGISQEPVVKNGQIVVGNVMKLTLSSDHRVVDGAKAAEFLKTLKDLLEEPLRLLL
ncbi:MAG: pyruvate dehydrogenase complex dihydrolipoamide acetyltransferase [Pseudopedobacter saltans]|uniref:Acetyltransferase component of pyruvate dehydrogenase complex n=1 Tax=Pseudopedobacter saltans TaxID=151895 RepID=A0A2W5F846_9SPHI|nr:MAG: pyruvate dehydrogenase complex dihydrolipoamide acetyltransferase [Pseudopedobacter saltans]